MSSEPSGDNANSQQSQPIEVFLDTSIHITRLESDPHKAKIDHTLEGFRWKGTCSYTQIEYGNVILASACYYYRKLEKLGDLETLSDFIYHHLPSNRKYKQWYHSLLRHSFNRDEATERAKLLLQSLMTVGTSYVSGYCDEVRDGIKCAWARQEVSPRTPWKRPDRAKCRIDKFFEENKDTFRSLEKAIRQAPEKQTDELKTFADLIQQAQSNPSLLRDCKVCRKLADAIIAVESEGYSSFFTQNIKESDVLCRPLKQKLLYFKQNADDPVEVIDYRDVSAPPSDE